MTKNTLNLSAFAATLILLAPAAISQSAACHQTYLDTADISPEAFARVIDPRSLAQPGGPETHNPPAVLPDQNLSAGHAEACALPLNLEDGTGSPTTRFARPTEGELIAKRIHSFMSHRF